MAVLRRQAQMGGLIAIAGVVLVFLGFLISSAGRAAGAGAAGPGARPRPAPAAYPASRPHSIAVQRSITTDRPASWAIRAASQSTTPSWSHRQRAPAATASWAWGTHRSERRKTSTMSNGPVAAVASASVG